MLHSAQVEFIREGGGDKTVPKSESLNIKKNPEIDGIFFQ